MGVFSFDCQRRCAWCNHLHETEMEKVPLPPPQKSKHKKRKSHRAFRCQQCRRLTYTIPRRRSGYIANNEPIEPIGGMGIAR